MVDKGPANGGISYERPSLHYVNTWVKEMSYLHVVMWRAEGGKLRWKRDKRWGEGAWEKVRERINMCEKGEEEKGDTLHI